MNVRYSETFFSFQGEGLYTGCPTTWLRFWGCNLQCKGFSQPNPTDESTYIDPLASIELSTIKKFEDLPVVEYGCDSIYSHDKRFRNMAYTMDAKEMAEHLISLNKSDTNPDGLWNHPVTKEHIHLAFTGGEPLMNQEQIVEILQHMIDIDNYPTMVTIETNGTKSLQQGFVDFFNKQWARVELFWSISPKLHTVSGETEKKAWKPEVFESYTKHIKTSYAQIKFVVKDSDESKEELIKRLNQIDNSNYIFAMPVGSTKEQQEVIDPEFVQWLMKNGMRISGRLHSLMLGNAIGL